METGKLILTDAVSPPNLLAGLSKIEEFSDARKVQAAKDFESVLIDKLLDQVKQTAGQMGLDEDTGGRTIRDMFWLYLGRHISSSGGFGMWKDIYRWINNSQTNSTQQLDKSV